MTRAEWEDYSVLLFLFALVFSYWVFFVLPAPQILDGDSVISPIPEPRPTPKIASPSGLLYAGQASFYSRNGCLGCSETLTMANGDTLDDTQYTIALPPAEFRKHKNEMVTVRNPGTGKSVQAKVTDTGGFAKYNRVADLSLATKESIGCLGICTVEILRRR